MDSSSQSRAATTTFVAAAAAAAAMVTMAGTVWLMTPANFDEDISEELLDVNGRRKPKSSLLNGTKSPRRRRRPRNHRRVRWQDQAVSSPPASLPSTGNTSTSTSTSTSSSSSSSSLLLKQDSSQALLSASEPTPESTSESDPLTSPSDSKENQSSLAQYSEGNNNGNTIGSYSESPSNKSSTSSSTSFWSSPSSPLARLSKMQESAAKAIVNSVTGSEQKRQNDDDDDDDKKMNQNRIMRNGDSRTNNGSSSNAGSIKGHKNRSSSNSSNGSETPYMRFIQYLKPLRKDAWEEPDVESFMVRGPTYTKNSKKINSDKPAFSLLTVDLIQHIGQEPYYQPICGHPRERVQQAIKREEEFGSADKELPPFVFAVNLCLPSSTVSTNKNNGTASTTNLYHHQVSYFAVENMDEIENETTPFGKLMKKFIFGDDDSFRDKTFKLIPRIVKGNIIVKRAVGSKPAIIGKKVNQHYFRGDRYFEILVDIGSDSIADRIVRLALGYAKSLVTDICFVLEGNDIDTLPERIFGGVTLKYIDFKSKDGNRRMLPLDYTP
ncbi:unnamed protein product [Cylindrotheca closterium]|uniref:Protein ENHANCED DISEASE RESISTANCE 2 C-terminal domain-containing protein n=1 Tax=Cylindrotheca closterium TaxID=2856 RepID=A0AAD2GBK3_9STRA|nr:unnamed protein product [Cylindrotheca closterium]